MQINQFVTRFKKPAYRPIIQVGLFSILLLSFHYLFLYWSGSMNFYPIKEQVNLALHFTSFELFKQSVWVLHNIFHLDISTQGQTIYIVGHAYVEVTPGCSGLKQGLHWLFLMVLFPGPWKHKLWYIPLGLLAVHAINVLRIVGLSLCMVPWPNHFHFLHDYIFKTLFYVGIFMMWVGWVEWFVNKKTKTK